MASTVATGGTLNPVVAAAEGAGALLLSVLSVALPLVALVSISGLTFFVLTRRRPEAQARLA